VLGRDGAAGLVCLAGSLWLLALSARLPTPALVPVGPGFYPRVVLALTAVLAALLVLADLRARRRARAPAAAPPAPRANRRLVGWTFGVFALYVVLLPALGYRIATAIFVALLQAGLEPGGRRPWGRIALVAVGTALLTHLAFERYLLVLLPRSRWLDF
jgi:hypothetical protein